MERRLATILAADVVAFSRLMEADDEATVSALDDCRRVIDSLTTDHRGRIFATAGDSVVAAFPSPVEAVRCAVEIQRALADRNADRPEERRMRLRIGVNLGDVIVDGDNLLGDGVNLAARLQALANPGGIYLSRPVYDQVKKQPDLEFEFLGRRMVKNISDPVGIYRVRPADDPLRKTEGGARHAGRLRRRHALVAALLVLVGIGAVLAWMRPWAPIVDPASAERMAFPLPDKPSVVVLPFRNISGDAGQDHVADGLTADITAALSQVSRLFVIARSSAFAYRDQTVDVRQVAEELGVRYVLEGSVQASADTMRITARLIDALAGTHIWAERYDRDHTDLFALQDEITDRIVVALRIELTEGEEARVYRQHTRSMEAWDLLSRGREQFYRANKAENLVARDFFQQAIDADPGYALAYALLAGTYWQEAFHGWAEDRAESIGHASRLASKAQDLDATLPDVYAIQAAILLFQRDYDAAIAAGERSVALNPNHANNTALLALCLHYAGRPDDAVRLYKTAMRLSPYYPDWYLEELGFTYLDAGQPREALLAFEEFLARDPAANHAAHARIGRALAYHVLNQGDAARSEIGKALDADPGISLTQFRQLSLHKDSARVDRGLTVLRDLGLPE